MNWQSEPDEELLSIAEVRVKTGVSARTLRYYEELGLLPDVRRRAGGRRVYGPDEIERLDFIQRLKKLGLSLSEVKELNAVYAIGGSTHDMLRRLEELLDGHRAELDARIEELIALRSEIGRYRDHVDHRLRALHDTRDPDGEAPGEKPPRHRARGR